jgi:hypothetical protein
MACASSKFVPLAPRKVSSSQWDIERVRSEELAVNRDQLERIIGAVPKFRARWDSFLKEWEPDGEPPWYVGMSELAHYAVECQAQSVTSELPGLFSTIEEILQEPDADVEGLIAVGLFEDIQSIASHRQFGAAPFRERLGTRSLQIWDEVDEGMKRVAAWQQTQKPKWWQFWRKRKTFDAETALSQVQSPELRKILEAEYRSKR